jgi:hypothetical protein
MEINWNTQIQRYINVTVKLDISDLLESVPPWEVEHAIIEQVKSIPLPADLEKEIIGAELATISIGGQFFNSIAIVHLTWVEEINRETLPTQEPTLKSENLGTGLGEICQVGQQIRVDAAAPGYGHTIYRITEIDDQGNAWGVVVEDTIKELQPWQVQ